VIRDVWLGCTYKLLQIGILLYVIIYALIINEGYIKKDFSTGSTIILKNGGEIVTGTKNNGNLLILLNPIHIYRIIY
jgi:hypothetical protein